MGLRLFGGGAGSVATVIYAGSLVPIAPALLPFAPDSVWRLGIAEDAEFADEADARNTSLQLDVDTPGKIWLNYETYSHPVSFADEADPLATVTDSFHAPSSIPPGGSWQTHIPADARIAAGTDKHMHVISPDGATAYEHFNVTRQSSTAYTTTRRHAVNLRGPGIGPQNGTRAYGGSAIGGLIRAWEVDPTHPDYTGEIQHPLAVSLRSDQLHYSGVTLAQDGNGGMYNAQGYGLEQGYVWPATEQDAGSSNPTTGYTGAVPMGSFVAIPDDVDIDTLGLTTENGKMLARACQNFGAYVTDRSGSMSFYLEDDGGTYENGDATAVFRRDLLGASATATELRKVVAALRVVTSNSEVTPNGGPLRAARRGAGVTRGDLATVRARLTTVEGATTPVASSAKRYRSTTQTGAKGTYTTIELNATSFSAGPSVDATEWSAIKVTEAGIYQVEMACRVTGGDVGDTPGLYVQKNYATNIMAEDFSPLTTSNVRSATRSAVLSLAANDALRIVFANAAVTSDYTIAAGELFTYLTVTRVH